MFPHQGIAPREAQIAANEGVDDQEGEEDCWIAYCCVGVCGEVGGEGGCGVVHGVWLGVWWCS